VLTQTEESCHRRSLSSTTWICQQLQQVFEPPARYPIPSPHCLGILLAQQPDGAEEAPILDYNFDLSKGGILRSLGWRTNICYNALDRHVLAGRGDRVAFYWEGNDPEDRTSITYAELLRQVCRFANVLKSNGVKKGDRVAIYMPMVLELVVAMLACARIGAVHSIVFGGFSAGSLADRIINAKCHILITCDGKLARTKLLSLKSIADKAMSICIEEGNPVVTCLVPRSNGPDSAQTRQAATRTVRNRDSGRPKIVRLRCWPAEMSGWHEAMAKEDISDDCQPEWLGPRIRCFMLYTSGSTGKPKGVLHTVGGYMVYSATTFKYSFDYHMEDIYWCTADIGWITGHSYVVYGRNGQLRHIRDACQLGLTLAAAGMLLTNISPANAFVEGVAAGPASASSPQLARPNQPRGLLWYHRVVGRSRCSVVDTFWQTETGGHVITAPLPGATPTKPGSACFPFFWRPAGAVETRRLAMLLKARRGLPGLRRALAWHHADRTTSPSSTATIPLATVLNATRSGYLWVTGRIDDMINVSGHLLSTAQIESALVEHPKVAEAAVVGRPSRCQGGESAYAFVTLKDGATFDDSLVRQLLVIVRERIGAFAAPDTIQEAPALPKTRSGKIMRRILREIAAKSENYGDVSTLADPGVIETLVAFSDRLISIDSAPGGVN
uniref:acetate--CoA ligase n=1 Tax=Macrostomum lignano TaxID=282301 RepID=A0A1I8FEE5_9PLAT